MIPSLVNPIRRRVANVLVITSFMQSPSVWRAAALAIPDVGLAVFFVGGIAATAAGRAAPWYVLAAVLMGLACRTLDIEGWGVPVRGGLVGRAGAAFGPRAAAGAAAAQLLERILFGSLMAVVFGRYVAALPVWLFVPADLRPTYFRVGDTVVVAAIGLLGFAWIRARLGYTTAVRPAVWRTWVAASVVLAMVGWAWLSASVRHVPLLAIPASLGSAPTGIVGWLSLVVAMLFTFEHTLAAVGSGDSLARAAGELEAPRTRGIRRTLIILLLYGVVVTFGSAVLFVAIVPSAQQAVWAEIPLFGIVEHLPAPALAKELGTLAIAAAAALLLGQAVRAGISGGERMLVQLAEQGRLTRALTLPHASLGYAGTRQRYGRRRHRGGHRGQRRTRRVARSSVRSVPRLDPAHEGRGALPPPPAACGSAVSRAVQPLDSWRRVADWTRGDRHRDRRHGGRRHRARQRAEHCGDRRARRRGRHVCRSRPAACRRSSDDGDPLRLVTSQALTLDQIDVRPGGILVAVRNPNALAHLSDALAAADDRDVTRDDRPPHRPRR